jgi:hypothetical protein
MTHSNGGFKFRFSLRDKFDSKGLEIGQAVPSGHKKDWLVGNFNYVRETVLLIEPPRPSAQEVVTAEEAYAHLLALKDGGHKGLHFLPDRFVDLQSGIRSGSLALLNGFNDFWSVRKQGGTLASNVFSLTARGIVLYDSANHDPNYRAHGRCVVDMPVAELDI